MEYRSLGKSGLDVSVLCGGTMMMGEQTDRDESFAILDAMWDAGINFYDTAEVYPMPAKAETGGESERIVGAWIAERGLRDKVVLATKIAARSNYDWIREDGQPAVLTGPQIRYAVEQSLTNLQTDYIDLYQVHWPARETPMFGKDAKGYVHYGDDYPSFEEAVDGLDALRTEGKIRFTGLANETPWGVMRHLQTCDSKHSGRPVVLQNVYNLLSRYLEYGLAEVVMNESLGVMAYSPMAQGFLSGKYLNGQNPEGSRGAMGFPPWRYNTPSGEEALREYLAIANDHGLDPMQMALSFVVSRPFMTSAIVGASRLEHVRKNVEALSIDMTAELEDAINTVHTRVPNPCP